MIDLTKLKDGFGVVRMGPVRLSEETDLLGRVRFNQTPNVVFQSHIRDLGETREVAIQTQREPRLDLRQNRPAQASAKQLELLERPAFFYRRSQLVLSQV